MRVAILGGAFDPVHLDHLEMARAALSFGYCDEVWLLPSPDRWDKHPEAKAEHRLAMLRIGTQALGLPISVRDSEITAGEYRGSLHMLRRLHRDHPDHEFLLLVGADSVMNIPQWRDPLEYDGTNPNGLDLLREFALIVYPRKGYMQPIPTAFQEQGWRTPMVFDSSIEPGVAASREIRPYLAKDPTVQKSLPPGVWEYIRENRLYNTTAKTV